MAASTQGSETASPASIPAPARPLPNAPARYRPVGCQSHGDRPFRSGPARREVAIGFDDGPSPDTAALVRMLARSHARATFFVIGDQVTARYRATLREELRDGDAIGDHTFTHPDLTRSGDVRAQLADTLAAIRSQTGYTPCVFRPPYGDADASVVNLARSLGLATVLWDDDPSDYTQPGTREIERRVLAKVRPGAIIISHDGGGPRGPDTCRLPSDHRRAACARLSDRHDPRAAGLSPALRPLHSPLRRHRSVAQRADAERDHRTRELIAVRRRAAPREPAPRWLAELPGRRERRLT